MTILWDCSPEFEDFLGTFKDQTVLNPQVENGCLRSKFPENELIILLISNYGRAKNFTNFDAILSTFKN